MKKLLKLVLPLIILAAGAAVFAALKASKPEQPKAEIKERVWRVEVESIQPQRLAPALTLYGRVETPRLFKAAAPASARVQEVWVKEGERVSEGELLLVLDQRDFRPRVAQAEAEVADLQAQIDSEKIRAQADRQSLKFEEQLLKLSSQAVQRQHRLVKQQLGSDASVDEAQQALARQELTVTSRQRQIREHPSRLQALEAKLQKAQAGLAQTMLDLERSRVTAPYDAIVAEVKATEGDQVAGNQVLLSLYAPDSLELRARIPAPYQAELQQAMQSGDALKGLARMPGAGIQLQLDRLAGQADSNGVDALFKLLAGGEWLRSGQLLRFDLLRPAREPVVAVPYAAVYGQGRVYLLSEQRMRAVDVEIVGPYQGDDGEERLLVQSPSFKSGDSLVLTHLPNAIDGLRAEAVDKP